MVLLRYAARLNGFTSLALTKVDVLGGLEKVPVCLRYTTAAGETYTDYPPTVAEELEKVTPVYSDYPGWPEFTPRLKERVRREGVHALPAPLREFLQFITRETRIPVEYLGFGPQREDTLWLGRGAPSRSVLSPWGR